MRSWMMIAFVLIFGCTATPAQKEIVDIGTIFLMLPDDATSTYISNEQRQEWVDAKRRGEAPPPGVIYDVRNRYMNLGDGQFVWEMCYWDLKGGRKLVAVNDGTEKGSEIRLFFYES